MTPTKSRTADDRRANLEGIGAALDRILATLDANIAELEELGGWPSPPLLDLTALQRCGPASAGSFRVRPDG